MRIVVYKLDKENIEKLPKVLDKIILKKFGKLYAKVVLIKPNICGFYPPDLNLLDTLLAYLTHISEVVIIGETNSTIYKPEDRFKQLGIIELMRKYGQKVKALNLMKDKIIKVQVMKPHTLKKIPLPRLVFSCDLLINLARIGRHPTTIITAASKNLFGLVANSHKYIKYHIRGIDRVIADIVKLVKPDINIVEVKNNILVSEDILAVDIIATKLFGLNPLNVKHLNLIAIDEGFDLDEYLSLILVREI